MEVHEINNRGSRTLDIHIPSISRTRVVVVSQHVSYVDMTWGEATVNWSAVGDVTSPQALEFAEALKYAAQTAQNWNSIVGTKLE